MRFVSAQFEALLAGDLWLRSARHANEMAARLAAAVEAIDGVEITHPVEANAVFARLPRPAIDRLLAELPGEHPFYVWDAARDEVRWMCSWDTTEADVDGFAAHDRGGRRRLARRLAQRRERGGRHADHRPASCRTAVFAAWTGRIAAIRHRDEAGTR